MDGLVMTNSNNLTDEETYEIKVSLLKSWWLAFLGIWQLPWRVVRRKTVTTYYEDGTKTKDYYIVITEYK